MLEFLSISILLVFGVLQIFLFFKVWGMTNDVRELRDFIISDTYDKRIETLDVGDEVLLKSSGQRVKITKVGGSHFVVKKSDGKVCVSKKDVTLP